MFGSVLVSWELFHVGNGAEGPVPVPVLGELQHPWGPHILQSQDC